MIDHILNLPWYEGVGIAYLIVCVILFVATVGIFGYEDIKGKHDPKFGPNYKSGFSWIILGAVSIPVVNLLVLGLLVIARIQNKPKVAKDAKSV